MTRFVLTREAERDLNQIKSYLAGRAGPTITRRVMQEIRAAIMFVVANPNAGHAREDLTERPVRFWPIYSYLIVYDPAVQPIRIVRVLHGMRDVESFLL